MADFKISQLPVASSPAQAGDFMIINKGNTVTNRIDVKEFVDDFVKGEYLSLNAGTNNQNVNGTGVVKFMGPVMSESGGFRVNGGSPDTVVYGMYKAGANTRIVSDSKDVLNCSSSGHTTVLARGSSTAFSITGDVSGAGASNSRVMHYTPNITGDSTATIFVNADITTVAGNTKNITHYYSSTVGGDGTVSGLEAMFVAAGSTSKSGKVRGFMSSISPDTDNGADNYSFYCARTTAKSWFGSDTYFAGSSVDQAPVRITGNSGTVNIDVRCQVGQYSDYWGNSSFSYFGLGTVGLLGTQGNNAVHLTCNGYRAAEGKWKSLVDVSSGDDTGASQIQLDPDGVIKLNAESDKSDGDSASVETKFMIQPSTNETIVGNKSLSGRAILYVNGDFADGYGVPDNSSTVRIKPRFPNGGDSGGSQAGVSGILVESPSDFKAGTEYYAAFRASGGRGANNDVQNLVGFHADRSVGVTGENATGYGFFSDVQTNVSAGSINYNFYAEGPATNFFRASTVVSGQGPEVDFVAASSDDFGVQMRNDGVFRSRRNVKVDSEVALEISVKTETDDTISNSTQKIANFRFINKDGDQLLAGAIECDGSGGVVLGSTSDYRSKKNVVPISSGIDLIKALRPVEFSYNWSNKTRLGFIAHEVAEVIPSAVIGQKDRVHDIGVLKDADGRVIDSDIEEPAPESLSFSESFFDEEGNENEIIHNHTWEKTATVPMYQTMDENRIIPALTKALQEALGIIDDLKARVEALEGN